MALFKEPQQKDIVFRCVAVDRTRTPQEVIDAMCFTIKHIDGSVVTTMPQCSAGEVDVFFFNLGRYINDVELSEEFERRGLKPVDPLTLIAVNESNPDLDIEHPNCTHWKDDNGNWCFIAFHVWDGAHNVDVMRSEDSWTMDCWFAGCRK